MGNCFTCRVLILLPVLFSCVLIAIKHVDSACCLVIIGTVLTHRAVGLAEKKKRAKKEGFVQYSG